jgi:hypothetical protein
MPADPRSEDHQGDGRKRMVQSDSAALLPVDGSHRHFAEPKPASSDLAQQIVRIAVASPQVIPCDGRQRPLVHRNVATLRIRKGHVECEAGRPRQEPVADPALPGHRDPGPRPAEAVALHKVCLVRDECGDQRPKIVRMHLPIRGHHGRYVESKRACANTPARDCSSYSSIN